MSAMNECCGHWGKLVAPLQGETVSSRRFNCRVRRGHLPGHRQMTQTMGHLSGRHPHPHGPVAIDFDCGRRISRLEGKKRVDIGKLANETNIPDTATDLGGEGDEMQNEMVVAWANSRASLHLGATGS